jgi:hypothetical protein
MHCWTLPPHQEAWKRFAALQGGRGPYLRFANMLINDATYLLDDALKKVQVRVRLQCAFSVCPACISHKGSAIVVYTRWFRELKW